MKNKRQFFSVSLYLDALKQLRIMGIVILIFVGFVSASIAMVGNESYFIDGENYSFYIFSLFSFIFFSPVMTLYIFRFLTSRKASDMFHSIPYTRVALYFSYVCAVITYVILILIVDFMAYFIAGGEFDITIEYVLSLILCNLLVISAINLAQGMTGTIFTNICVTGIILFFPRLLIDFVEIFVYEVCPYLGRGWMKFPLESSNNILTGIFMHGISIITEVEVVDVIYTFILSLFYFGLAVLLFNRRKSEMAEAAVSNRLYQNIIRSIVTLVICLLPLSDILYKYIDEDYYQYGNFGVKIFLTYIFAIFVYFLYELLSTKKVRNIVKIIPGIIVIAILNVTIVLCVFGISEYVRKFQPKEEDVEYIIIYNDGCNEYCTLTDSSHFMHFLGDRKITDERIIKLFCEQYEDEVEGKKSNHQYGRYYISFCVDGKMYDRFFSINETRYQLMLKYLAEDERILNNYRNLPEFDELKDIRMGITGNLYNVKDKKDVYEKYREDLSKLTSSDVISLVGRERKSNEGYIEITYIRNNKECVLELPFIEELPSSYNKYLELVNEQIEEYMENFVNDIELMLLKRDEFYFSIVVKKSGEEREYVYFSYDDILENKDEHLEEKIIEFCEEAVETYKAPEIEEYVYEVSLGGKHYLFSASEECMELFKELKKYY